MYIIYLEIYFYHKQILDRTWEDYNTNIIILNIDIDNVYFYAYMQPLPLRGDIKSIYVQSLQMSCYANGVPESNPMINMIGRYDGIDENEIYFINPSLFFLIISYKNFRRVANFTGYIGCR